MKLQFDPNQTFQLEAVAAVVDLFDGQPQGAADYSVIRIGEFEGLFSGQARTELGLGNQLAMSDARLIENTRQVQLRNDIEIADPSTPLEGWDIFDLPANAPRRCPHFSVEMETGTGKTYVYLRTIFELSQRYGFQKFIIVVPSVAIREGVLKNIQITSEHFNALYNNPAFSYFVYDAKKINHLRQFAIADTLQIMVINIDAFRKNFTGTEAEQRSNVIYKESDRLSGRQPIEFVQAARPIVIIDEPQSVDNTDKAQEAIKALNPLLTLRYSATHKHPYNLVYRLDPVRAFTLKLVKEIQVAEVQMQANANDPFVHVEAIEYQKGIKARLRIHVQTPDGPKEKSFTIKNGADLYALSNERHLYQNGFVISEINAEPGDEFIRFDNGRVLRLHEEIGGVRDDLWRIQIKHTVERHLAKELKLRERGVKVLSLFFIDQVANYRSYDEDGRPVKGKFAVAIDEILTELARLPRFAALDWLRLPPEHLYNGYFAQDKKGAYKDTRGDTQADDEAYSLIMRDKERLLSFEEPLRFIFSHSALREGWDNPNVFQICNLRQMTTERERRQTIGRGLRLPVDQSGERVRDESVNKLLVTANESYADFARALQQEYETEAGISFGKLPLTALARLTFVVDDQEQAIGRPAAEEIRRALVARNVLDADGHIQPGFDPQRPTFADHLPEAYRDLAPAITDLIASYRIERYVTREVDERTNHLTKRIELDADFQALWERIKPRTTYRVEFSTEELITRCIAALRRMDKIEMPTANIVTGQLAVSHAGITAAAVSVKEEMQHYRPRLIPDILAYLQNETELTRATLARILKESGRLVEFFNDPQRFMDAVVRIIKHELHRLLVDGIKYERLPASDTHAEWEMTLFKSEEMINYLNALQVKKSVYEYIVYDSEIERQFAEKLDQRDDIKLFVKLPSWFQIDTPVGKYNPDWAIVKHDDETVYLVRETKSTHDFLQLRTSEADKVRCGQRHFEALDVPFAVAVTADEV